MCSHSGSRVSVFLLPSRALFWSKPGILSKPGLIFSLSASPTSQPATSFVTRLLTPPPLPAPRTRPTRAEGAAAQGGTSTRQGLWGGSSNGREGRRAGEVCQWGVGQEQGRSGEGEGEGLEHQQREQQDRSSRSSSSLLGRPSLSLRMQMGGSRGHSRCRRQAGRSATMRLTRM